MKHTICVPMDDELQKALVRGLASFPFQKNDDIEFVHIFEEQHYHYMLQPMTYPLPDQRQVVQESVLEVMKGLKKSMTYLNEVKTNFYCAFHSSPKDAMVEHLGKRASDIVHVATRGKNGVQNLFTSSFADHLLKFSPCNVYVVR